MAGRLSKAIADAVNWRLGCGMKTTRKKRALVLVGAGASLEFGAPSTDKLTGTIETKVRTNKWMQCCGGASTYSKISETLANYLQDGADAVTFEHIYHCAHELLFTFEPTPKAVNEYRPILVPFIKRRIETDENALQELVRAMAEFIFAEISAVCEDPKTSLEPLTEFLDNLRVDHITRIYTTNYDDFLWQAAGDLYTGFDCAPNHDAKRFDGRAFWEATDEDSVFHLHGSVHIVSPLVSPQIVSPQNEDLGSLYWFDDRATALNNLRDTGSRAPCMDGSQIIRTAIITGLDKLSRLQQQPFSHYYASMARDALTADIIYVIGYGLRDLHLNTWLGEARRTNPKPPLIFVDRWPHGFRDDTEGELDHKTTEMFHKLCMHINENYEGEKYGSSWTLDKDRTCAIWDKGFLSFLRAPEEFENVIKKLT